MQHSRFVSLNAKWRGRNTFLDLMAMLMQFRMLVAFFDMKVYFWLIVTLPTRALKSFSAQLFQLVGPACTSGYSSPGTRLWISFCWAEISHRKLVTPLKAHRNGSTTNLFIAHYFLVSSANFQRVHCLIVILVFNEEVRVLAPVPTTGVHHCSLVSNRTLCH